MRSRPRKAYPELFSFFVQLCPMLTGIDKFIVKEEDFQDAFRTLERNLAVRIPLVGRPLEGLLFPEEREAVVERKRRQREEGLLDRLLEDLIEED